MWLRLLIGVIAMGYSFFLYGAGRNMAETFGTTLRGFTCGLFICLIGSIPIVAGICILSKWRYKCTLRVLWPYLFVVSFGVALGILEAEIQMLNDEVTFAKEVIERPDPGTTCGRPRVWPNSLGGLVYSKSRGFTATD